MVIVFILLKINKNAELTGATFETCDLQGTIFKRTNLQNADSRTFYNYSIDPEINQIDNAKFSLSAVTVQPGL